MENKTEINCPNCSQKVRIPTGKHIKFICPNCSNEFEIDGRVKEASKNSNYTWLYGSILSGLLFFGYKYYTKTNENKIESNPITNSENVLRGNQGENATISDNAVYDKNLTSLIKAVDISNETTNDFAVRLASKFPGEYNIGQICQIYDYIVRNWKYVNDSDKMENFRSASRTIKNNFSGDCDDFAILLAALIESIGGDARISFAYNDEGGHAFTEVLATNSKEDMQAIVEEINTLYGTDQFEIHYYEDTDGRCWLNLDWFGQPQHPGGQYFNYNKRTIYYPTIENPTYTQE
jgi:predicted RNA-binding Zn-ribbon protein involved in translation (DUF1610 family)